uniref:Peptidase S1 domain-containing protein n=1 Tax=Graphocephala atropunctata TaxID=36148 RepID=A0A1B6L0G0_9HEMI
MVLVLPLKRRVHTFTLGTGSDVDVGSTPLPLDTVEVAVDTTTVSGPDNGSTESSDSLYPYMAAILHVNGTLLGAGAIVGKRWIVATAFQMGAFKPPQLTVRVGSERWSEGGQLLAVLRMFPHPMFRQFNNDVALMKTAEDIVLCPEAQPILLATAAPTIGAHATLLMWNNDSRIEKSEADLLPASECRMFYSDFELTESNVCAVMDHILPYKVTLYGSPLVFNGLLVGHYMGMEANTFKPSLCSSLAPLSGWVHLMMTNETDTPLLFPLS